MENLFRDALEALTNNDSFYPYQDEILLSISGSSYWNNSQLDSICGRKIVLINSNNQRIIQRQNNNVIEILELEPPRISLDTLMIKINHMLCATFDLPTISYEGKRLTDDDKVRIDNLLKEAQRGEEFKRSTIFSPVINCKWTYVTFKFDCIDRRFKYFDIETKIR
jgi:hypothetical protein